VHFAAGFGATSGAAIGLPCLQTADAAPVADTTRDSLQCYTGLQPETTSHQEKKSCFIAYTLDARPRGL
jgi:hypothetical protein